MLGDIRMNGEKAAHLEVDALREEVERLESALHGAGQGVWDHDLASGTVRYSATWKTLRGYLPDDEVDEIAGPWIDRLHPEDRKRIDETTARQDAGELQINSFEYRERHRNGQWIWILSRGRPIAWLPDGRVARILGTDTDISALKEAELALAEEKERLLVTLRSIGEGIVCLDSKGLITSFNSSACELTGWSTEDAVGRHLSEVLDLRSTVDTSIAHSPVTYATALENGLTFLEEAEVVRRNGSRRRGHCSISPVMIRGTLSGFVAVIRDTTDEHEYKARLHHAATHDPLTGLPNRIIFEAAIERAVSTARLEGRKHTLCMLDLDHFKLVNDGAGHSAGDKVLQGISESLVKSCGDANVVARLGGDEFGILLADIHGRAAKDFCDTITKDIGKYGFQSGHKVFRVGVSVGMKCITGDEPSASKLMSLADEACYRAKAAGRGRWASADETTGDPQKPLEGIMSLVSADDEIASNFARATHLALISISGEGNIEFVNGSALKLFGYVKDEMLGKPITIIIPERMRGAHSSGLTRVAAGEKPNLGGKTVEVSAIRKDGTEFPIEITLSIWRDKDRMYAGAVIKDISERRERDNKLLRLASQDTLTGLHNRHRFTELLKAELASERPATLILMGLDGVKDVNDTHGHGVGDSLLQAVGVRLPYMLKAGAEVARFGGEEFAILIPNLGDPIVASQEVSAIMDGFSAPFDIGGHVLELDASIGYAISPAHGNDDEELVASADFALYRARAAGKRSVRMFEPSMRSESVARRSLRDELRRALGHGELVMHYQPQVYLATGEVFGCEALIRWQHPERGLLLPGAFLPALDQSSLTLDIGWWTLDEACRQLSQINAVGHRLRMGVNLFPAQMRSPNLCRKVADGMEKHGIDPSDLELEVTESVALHDNDKSLEALSALRAMGVGIAFDDFGTGYASLSSLQRYPLTTLKIDRGFIRDIFTHPQDAAITKALITMSGELGLLTVAEGIETAEQEAALREYGCLAAQGYRFGKPMSGNDFEKFVNQSKGSPPQATANNSTRLG
jgi:diguanylate cyclase (GGDEF)-like protein/PAS domain S-box-containing protein